VVELETAFRRVHRQLKPRAPVPVLKLEYFPSVAANHSAVLEGGTLRLRISDLFDDAPPEVLEALAGILLSRLYRRKVDLRHQQCYREYTLSPQMLDRSREVRRQRGRRGPRPGPRGRVYDLDQLFGELNARYFGGRLKRPELSWTRQTTRSVLGSYEFDDDVIWISRTLDSERVPGHVVRYILFHEMLHKKHGSRVEGSREIVHPPEFRQEERAFPHFHRANRWLDTH
jgi:hypothetical protein